MYAIASGSPGRTALAQQGAMFAAVISGPGGSAVHEVEIDPGSSISSVDHAILQALGCQQVGSTMIATVTGQQQTPIYAASIATLAGVSLSAGLPGVLGDSLPAGGPRALVGRDILEKFTFVLSEPKGTWSLQAPGAGLPAGSGIPTSWWFWVSASAGGTLAAVGAAALIREALRARRKVA